MKRYPETRIGTRPRSLRFPCLLFAIRGVDAGFILSVACVPARGRRSRARRIRATSHQPRAARPSLRPHHYQRVETQATDAVGDSQLPVHKEEIVVTGTYEPVAVSDADRDVERLEVRNERALYPSMVEVLRLDPEVDLRSVGRMECRPTCRFAALPSGRPWCWWTACA